MTQLGDPGQEIVEIRRRLTAILTPFKLKVIDAESVVTGKDLLFKIWELLIAVPLGIAIVHEEMPAGTLANIFYELGVLQAYGKETLIVKTEKAKVPSDFVRTEHVKFDSAFNK